MNKQLSRKLYVLHGTQEFSNNLTTELTDYLIESALNVIVSTAHEKHTNTNQHCKFVSINQSRNDIENTLGDEVFCLIINAYHGFNPNLFSALSGMVNSPGFVFLIVPELDHWPDYPDPDYNRIITYPDDINNINGNFFKYFIGQIKQSQKDARLTIYGQHELQKKTIHSKLYNHIDQAIAIFKQKDFSRILPNRMQGIVINEIISIIDHNDERIISIISKRGRGKSTAIGIAIVTLLKANLDKDITILICSQSKNNINNVFKAIDDTISFSTSAKIDLSRKANESIRFIPPDELILSKPKCELLVIEEAASIAIFSLKLILNHYEKIVFSTTIDGYEGTGRGYEIKFIQQTLTSFKHCKTFVLVNPLRWNNNDQIEYFIDSVFLEPDKIDAHTKQTEAIKNLILKEVLLEKISISELLKNKSRLKSIFNLLKLAHYRTTPDDLRFILDAPNSNLWIASYRNNIIGLIQTLSEGNLAAKRCSIVQGKRRVKGHLVPQSLALNYSSTQACEASYLRITRIVVSETYRNLGVGKHMMSQLENEIDKFNDQLDFLCVSYGLNPALFSFWEKIDFTAVRLSHRNNARSGLKSIMMLKPLNDNITPLFANLSREFIANLNFDRRIANPYYCSEIKNQLLQDSSNVAVADNKDNDKQTIEYFAYAYRPFESAHRYLYDYALWAIEHHVNCFKSSQIELMKSKIINNDTWKISASKGDFTGKSQCLMALRDIFKIIYSLKWGNKS